MSNSKTIIFLSSFISVLVFITFFKCKTETKKSYDKDISIAIVDSLFLYNEKEITKYEHYNNKKYLSKSYDNSKLDLFIHNHEGKIIKHLDLPKMGPLKVKSYFKAIIDGDFLFLITHQEIIKCNISDANDISIIKRTSLSDKLVTFRGGYDSRVLKVNNDIIVSVFTENDIEFNMVSDSFVKEATYIKIFDSETLKLKNQLKFPKSSAYFKGVFQPTLYEPLIAVDKINNELEVLFPIDNNIYVYDLETYRFKKSIGIPLDIKLPKPKSFGNGNALKSSFNRDNDMPQFIKILNLNGNTLVGYKPSKVTFKTDNKYFGYVIMDNGGKKLKDFKLRKTNKYTYILDKLNEKEILTFPNLNNLKSDPPGYPLYVNRLEHEQK